MEGHVRKRGKKWYYSFEASNIDGKRKRIERVGGNTKKEAEAALRLALTEFNNAGLHFEPKDMSVSDYMDYWFKNYVMVNCKYNTQNGYGGILRNHIKPALGIYKLKALTPAILQEFINQKYLNGTSKNFLTNMITVLGGSLRYAVHPCKFLKENPMQYVKYPKYEHSKTEINHKLISPEDFKRLIERFPLGSTFYMPLMIGYYTGCRIGEVMGLTWQDINFEEGTIDINKIIYKRKLGWYFGSTKTPSSVRKIKVGKTLLDALKQHKKLQMENRLKYGPHYIQQYVTEEKDPTNRGNLKRIHSLQVSIPSGAMEAVNMVNTKESGEIVTTESFKYAARVIHYSLGIVFNFHSLRHTHATTLLENGANIKDVQTRLGHTNIETTLGTYTHATRKMAEQSVDIFENAVNDDLSTK